jgi:protein TonB
MAAATLALAVAPVKPVLRLICSGAEVRAVAEKKGLAIAALALGIVGLFTAGGLGIGSLLGIALAGASLIGVSRGGRDVAWAALAANVFALLTIVPVGAAVFAYRAAPAAFASGDDELPEPAQNPSAFVEAPPPPPPPPPARPRPERTTKPPAELAPPKAEAPVAEKRLSAEDAPTSAAEPVRALRVGGSIREPRKLRHVSPVYPPEAVQARVQGVVILECTISPTGKVVDTKVLRGIPLLSEAAVEAVKQWEYTPTELNGVAVPVIMTVTVNFKLS